MAQSGASGGGQENAENAYTVLWILGVIFVISGLIWYFWSNQLKAFFILVRKYEIAILSFFIHTDNMNRAIEGINLATPQILNWKYAVVISQYVGGYLMYPSIVILLILAIFIFRSSSTMRYTKAYNMDTLVHQEKVNWPQISPVADLDLLEQDINQGLWAMAMTPLQFVKHYKLVKLERVADKKAVWRSEGVIQMTLNKEKAYQVFAAQLGPLWAGVEYLPPHIKALYAVFLARIEHDTQACHDYLSRLSASAASGNIDYSDTQAYLKKYGRAKPAQFCQQRHAYVMTVMATMLELARVDGVLASADFLWLKPLDRRLWYVLNTVGRQVAPAEIGGIFAHWLAEKHMGRALTVPMIDESVVGLEKALANIVYIPDEDEVI